MDRIYAECWLAYISNIVRQCDYVCVCVYALVHGMGRTEIKQSSNVILVI